jgi:hypothetical protein
VKHVAGQPACKLDTVRLIVAARETAILIWMRHVGRQLGALALLGLLVRAIVPDGYMIASAETAAGRIAVIEMCSETGAPAMAINLDTGETVDLPSDSKSPDHDPAKKPCVFAAAPHVAAAVSDIGPIVHLMPVDVGFSVAPDLRPGRGIAAPPPPATGPPSLI